MYSEEYDKEDEEQESGSFIKNFYYNNKVLVWIFVGIVAFILIMSLLTKGGSNKQGTVGKVSVTIYPQEEEIRVTLGYSTNLMATVENNPQASLEWSSEDDNIVKVDNDGNVMGLNYGRTKVTATYMHSDKQVYSASKTIIVADGEPGVTITDVSFKNGDLFMPVNSTYSIRLVINPPSGYIESKTFTSSNSDVAMVDNTGLITAVGEGEAIITIDVNGQFRDELNVYVDRNYQETEIIATPDKIDLDGELRKIKVGGKEKLSYTVEPENADRSRLTWSSSDESIVTVDESGWITGIQTGNAVVTVSSLNGKSDRIDIEVESDIVPVTDIELSNEEVYLSVGQTQTITPMIRPDNASNKALSYVSLDSSIASVNPNETGTQATITGNSAGTTTIIVKSTNDVEKRINVTVTGQSGSEEGGSQQGGSSQGGGNSSTIVVRVNGDKPTKSCDGQTLKYYNNPTIKITLNSGIGKIKYCYGTSKCTPNQEASSSTSFTIGGKGLYTLRIKKYDRNGNEIASSDSGNYYDGALEYYINTKGEGTTCQRSTATPRPTGDPVKECKEISNTTQCNATQGCSWCSGSCRKKELCLCCCTSNKSQCSWLYGCTVSQPYAISGVTTENVCKNKAITTSTTAPNPTPKPTTNSTTKPTPKPTTNSTTKPTPKPTTNSTTNPTPKPTTNSTSQKTCDEQCANAGSSYNYCMTLCLGYTYPTPKPSVTSTPVQSNVTPSVECKNPTYNGQEQVVAECKNGVVKGQNTNKFIRTDAIYYQVTCINNSSGKTATSRCRILPNDSIEATPKQQTTPTSTPVPTSSSNLQSIEISPLPTYEYNDIGITLTITTNSSFNRIYICDTKSSGCEYATYAIERASIISSIYISSYGSFYDPDYYGSDGLDRWRYISGKAGKYNFQMDSDETLYFFVANYNNNTHQIDSYSKMYRAKMN